MHTEGRMPSFNISPFSCAKLELAISDKQGCGSTFIFCGMGSSCSSQCREGFSSFLNADLELTSFTKFVKYYLIKSWKWQKNIADKLKAMELIQIYLIFKNKITITKISLHFFRFFLKIYPPGSGSAYWMWIRIVEGKLMRIQADPDPQPCR